MYVRRLITGTFGKTLISILLGLGLATLFRKVCKGRNCLVFQAPKIDKIENHVAKYVLKHFNPDPLKVSFYSDIFSTNL